MHLLNRINLQLGYTETDPKVLIPEALKRAKDLGLAGVEINLNFSIYFPERLTEDKIAKWRKAVDKSDIELSCHGPVDISLISRHDPIRKAAASRMCEFIELAIKLGAKRFTFHPGRAAFMKASKNQVLFFNRQYPQYLVNAFLESLTEIAKTAYDRIQLLLENTHELDEPVMKIIRRFAEEGLLAFAYDTAHGKDDSFLDNNIDYIKCCHLNDRLEDRSHLQLGTGNSNIAKAIERLKDRDCFFIIESGKYETVIKSIEYLRSISIK
ncbi:MAG: sugar phosphate isomerase/epimerase [candidate division Zixibacteria bacterium]|nr:sugar phosphate isomerase/epimerase [candidate division Zixibacteria bacterium]